MSSSVASRRLVSAAFLAGLAGAVAFILGCLIAIRPTLAGGVAGAICYVPLTMISVPAGLAIWIVVLFVKAIPGLAVSWMLAMMAVALVGSVIGTRPRLRDVLRGQSVLVAAFALLLSWLSLSLLWARDPGMAWTELRPWYTAAVVVVILAASISTPRHLRWLLAAFVLGGLISLAVGVVGHGPQEAAVGGVPAPPSNRFAGGEGNPNDLAVELVPVIVLAAGLAVDSARRTIRAGGIAAVVLLIIGLVATQSRGALIATALVLVAGLVIYQRQRRQVAIVFALVIALGGVSLVLYPNALGRVTNFGDGGSGRSTLWLVAWRMSKDYAPEGVGLNNFRAVAPYYVRRPGALGYVEQIDTPHIVHNTYLQLLAETGVIGLTLFAVVALVCLSAARRAARVFERLGEQKLVALSRAVLLAGVAALAGQLFNTNVEDMRFWVVLALGPALLTVAWRQLSLVGDGPPTPTRSGQPALNA